MPLFQAVIRLLECNATALGAAQSIVTSVAILVAAIWFVRRRLRFPRARVEQMVSSVDLGNGKLLLRVQTRIENVGDVLMRLKTICLYVQQIRPPHSSIIDILASDSVDPVKVGECELPWPALITREYDWRKKPYEVEPGEVETCHFDVILGSELQTVQIYTHVENRVKWFKKIGWNTTSVYEIEHDERRSSICVQTTGA